MSAKVKAPIIPSYADTKLRERVLRRIRNRPTMRGAAILLGALVLLAALAPVIAPQNPYDLASLSVMDNRLAPGESGMSGVTYWLGTDSQGRDMLQVGGVTIGDPHVIVPRAVQKQRNGKADFSRAEHGHVAYGGRHVFPLELVTRHALRHGLTGAPAFTIFLC